MKGLGSRVPWGEISRRRGMVTVLAETKASSWDESAPNLARKDSGLGEVRQFFHWLKIFTDPKLKEESIISSPHSSMEIHQIW